MAERTKTPKNLYSEKGQQLLSWMQLHCQTDPISNKELANELGTKPIAVSSTARALERRGVVACVEMEEGGKGVQLTDFGRTADPYATEPVAEPAEA